MNSLLKEELITYLSGFISEKRKRRFDEVIAQRTGYIRIVLENMYQAHNASAVLRSCDCFGIQHVHFIENRNELRISEDVAMGSSNWLTVHRHRRENDNTAETLKELKERGFRIVGTSPHVKSYTLRELPLDKPVALVFGTEIDGISGEVIEQADEFVHIPMFGFTESFNVSVSAALCMYELSSRVRSSVKDHLLSTGEQRDIYLGWLKNSVEKSEALIEDYLRKKKTGGDPIGL
jgi:tRNA (guanosine-2'-O-)-methyltransferase